MSLLPVACSGSPDSGAVALTFDDGPSEWTTSVLDALRKAEARATFFVIGRWLCEYAQSPGLLQRMQSEGHEVGNHTFDHCPQLHQLPNDGARRDQLRRTNELIEKLGLPRPRLMRPPAFGYDDNVRAIAAEPELGFTWLVDRSTYCDPRDWDRDNVSAGAIVHVASQASAGAIVLLHDGPPPERQYENCQSTVDALPKILNAIRRARLSLVTVSELLG